jgi:hypothetical protein
MQEAASLGRAQQNRISPVGAGLGAAFVAGAVTLAIMMSSPSTFAASDQSATSSNQCQIIHRKLLVSTTTGSGTVRLRAGSYLSPPIALGARPQGVVFPLPRPETIPVAEVIAIEGNASDVVITSEVSEYRSVIPNVTGVSAFAVNWKPMKGC